MIEDGRETVIKTEHRLLRMLKLLPVSFANLLFWWSISTLMLYIHPLDSPLDFVLTLLRGYGLIITSSVSYIAFRAAFKEVFAKNYDQTSHEIYDTVIVIYEDVVKEKTTCYLVLRLFLPFFVYIHSLGIINNILHWATLYERISPWLNKQYGVNTDIFRVGLYCAAILLLSLVGRMDWVNFTTTNILQSFDKPEYLDQLLFMIPLPNLKPRSKAQINSGQDLNVVHRRSTCSDVESVIQAHEDKNYPTSDMEVKLHRNTKPFDNPNFNVEDEFMFNVSTWSKPNDIWVKFESDTKEQTEIENAQEDFQKLTKETPQAPQHFTDQSNAKEHFRKYTIFNETCKSVMMYIRIMIALFATQFLAVTFWANTWYIFRRLTEPIVNDTMSDVPALVLIILTLHSLTHMFLFRLREHTTNSYTIQIYSVIISTFCVFEWAAIWSIIEILAALTGRVLLVAVISHFTIFNLLALLRISIITSL